MHIDVFHAPGDRDAADVAEDASAHGFAGFWMPETSHDPFLPLAVAAARGVDLRLGTSIAVAFARSPMTLAHTAWDLAAVTAGRFVLGLGTQVRAHVAGRFSMPWSAPVSRMRDFVAALRAIWRAWQTGEPLRYRGEHYRHVVMTPFFDPGPIDHPDVPVHLAAVGPGMARLAGEIADGIHIHPFHTPAYLADVILPAVSEGATSAGRLAEDVEVVAPLFVVTGPNDASLAAASGAVRSQIAFYASTSAYASVLEKHGWDVGERLTLMSRRGEWDEMARLVDDDMLRTIAVVATHDELVDAVRARAAEGIDRLGLDPSGDLDPFSEQWMAVMTGLAVG